MRGILQLVLPSNRTDTSVSSLPELAAHALPLIDRPFAQHSVEVMIDLGVTELDLIAPGSKKEYLTEFLALLGDGRRFGIRIRHWRTTLRRTESAILAELLQKIPDEELVLCALADRIPLTTRLPKTIPPDGIVLVDSTSDQSSGWVLASAATLRQGNSTQQRVDIPRVLSGQTAAAILEAQAQILNGKTAPMIPAPVSTPGFPAGVFVARGATIAPSAQLIGPCRIGTGCQIGEEVKIGENVVLSEGCIVEAGTTLRNMLALPCTYIGEGLECDSAILNGATLISTRYDTVVSVSDSFLLSSY